MSTTSLSNNLSQQTLCRTRPDITNYPGTYLRILFGDDEADLVRDGNEEEISTVGVSADHVLYTGSSDTNSDVWEFNILGGDASSSAV